MIDTSYRDGKRVPEATLILFDGSDRRWDSAPADVRIGVVRLLGWQIHHLETPASFVGHDSFLIKLNYELALEPQVPAPPWFEVGFRLSGLQTVEPVTVLDALPRAVFEACGPAAYAVGSHLSFTPLPHAMSATVDLPALSPFVDVFGVGGPEIRWRYLAPGMNGGIRGVRPGSYVSWIIVIVPAGCPGLDVQLSVRYDQDPDNALGCLPATHPAGFRLMLTPPPEGMPGPEPIMSSTKDGGTAGSTAGPPRVFISYAHNNERHVDSVRAFAELLCTCGLDVHMDRWDLNQRRDWYQWASGQVRHADYVIVIASPMCRLVGDGEIQNARHRGLQSEMALLRELLHSDRAHWTTKLLPVVLPGGSVSDIPLFLQPRTADHFRIENLTANGAEDLIRVITGQPPYRRPPTGESAVLPPRLRALE
jgi:hypothetical protein